LALYAVWPTFTSTRRLKERIALGRDQGKVEGARELLAPVHGWFTEGFDTRDLKEARAFVGL
jgi:predicted ATPase